LVGAVEAEAVGVSTLNVVVVKGLGHGDLPVLVQLVHPLKDGVGLGRLLKHVVAGSLVGEHVLATGSHGHGLAPGLSGSTLLGVVASLVHVGEAVLGVDLLAAGLCLLAVNVVASPVLVLTFILGDNEFEARNVLGVVGTSDASVPVLLVGDGGIEIDVKSGLSPLLVSPLRLLFGSDLYKRVNSRSRIKSIAGLRFIITSLPGRCRSVKPSSA